MFCRHFKVKEDTVYASEGGVVELKVYVTGNPQPDVYWRKGTNRDIDTRQGKYIIVDDSSLKVSNVLSLYKNRLKTIMNFAFLKLKLPFVGKLIFLVKRKIKKLVNKLKTIKCRG